MAEWGKPHDPTICYLQVTHFRSKDANRLKAKGWEKIFHANSKQKRTEVAIVISDKTDFNFKSFQETKTGNIY